MLYLCIFMTCESLWNIHVNSCCIISENVQAIYDVWFVGDQFFREVFLILQSLKRCAKVQEEEPPYIYEYYNVFGYYTMWTSGVKRSISRILNSLVTGLNTHERVPHLIVVMIDKDIVEDVGIFDHQADDILAENIEGCSNNLKLWSGANGWNYLT